MKPSAIMDTAMISAPRISSGLRPHLSTVTVAISVNTTITMPMITVCANEASPREAHVLEHLRAVIQHRVDADELLERGQQDADEPSSRPP